MHLGVQMSRPKMTTGRLSARVMGAAKKDIKTNSDVE